MNQEFNTSWKASKRPGKQRKYLAKAPLHIRGKFINVNLSKELRKKVGKRNIQIRTGDKVKILKGKHKKKEGKVTSVKLKTGKIYIEGLQVKKTDGSKANIPLRAPNLQIIEMVDRKQKPVKKSNLKTEEKEQENKK